jgi:alpha-L-rhamnosidase
MYRNISGIDLDPAAPAYRKSRIAPRVGAGLTSARASLETSYGTLASAWSLAGTQFVLEVTIPANTTAEVVLWDAQIDRVQERGRPVAGSVGVRSAQQQEDGVHLVVGSGSYRFSAIRNP